MKKLPETEFCCALEKIYILIKTKHNEMYFPFTHLAYSLYNNKFIEQLPYIFRFNFTQSKKRDSQCVEIQIFRWINGRGLWTANESNLMLRSEIKCLMQQHDTPSNSYNFKIRQIKGDKNYYKNCKSFLRCKFHSLNLIKCYERHLLAPKWLQTINKILQRNIWCKLLKNE